MTPDTNTADELDAILQSFYSECMLIADLKDNRKSDVELFSQAKAALTALLLKERLVELDLFEQFLNQRANKTITRGDLYNFKMRRLENLESRLAALNHNAEGEAK